MSEQQSEAERSSEADAAPTFEELEDLQKPQQDSITEGDDAPEPLMSLQDGDPDFIELSQTGLGPDADQFPIDAPEDEA